MTNVRLAVLKVAGFAALTLVTSPLCWGQITRPTADQAPPAAGTGHNYVGMGNEAVNPATGSVSIRIGVPVPPARGITVPFSFGYDSNAAQHFSVGIGLTDNASYLGQGGWSYVVPTVSEMHQAYYTLNHAIVSTADPVDPKVYVPCLQGQNGCEQVDDVGGFECTYIYCPPAQAPPVPINGPPAKCDFYDHFNFSDMAGGVHDLGILSQNNTIDCVSASGAPTTAITGTDGTVLATAGYPDEGPLPWVKAVDSNGIIYSFSSTTPVPGTNAVSLRFHNRVADNPNLEFSFAFTMLPSTIEDRNGNVATFTDHGNGSFQITDTLGRAAISTSGFGTSGTTVSVAGLANPYVVNWGPQSINWLSLGVEKVNAANLYPPVCFSGFVGLAQYLQGPLRPLVAITQIQLPNGQSYQFQYDPTFALVSKVIYPTGGYVRYVWGINSLCGARMGSLKGVRILMPGNF